MRIRNTSLALVAALAGLTLVLACNRRPTSTADVPRLLNPGYQITVAPFSQPTNTSQLIVGRIPENQGAITPAELANLDLRFRQALTTGSKRSFAYSGAKPSSPYDVTYHSAEQPQALSLWIDYGKRRGAQLLLVPMVLDWHQREGSRGGVTRPAHVRVEFYLLKVEDGSLMGRSAYEEEQTGLVNNLLTVGSFIKRKGGWVTAEDLAQEGMGKAIRELGL